jgi:hypothetical protein
MVGCIDERSLGRRFGGVIGELGRSVLGWLERMRLRVADTGDSQNPSWDYGLRSPPNLSFRLGTCLSWKGRLE